MLYRTTFLFCLALLSAPFAWSGPAGISVQSGSCECPANDATVGEWTPAAGGIPNPLKATEPKPVITGVKFPGDCESPNCTDPEPCRWRSRATLNFASAGDYRAWFRGTYHYPNVTPGLKIVIQKSNGDAYKDEFACTGEGSAIISIEEDAGYGYQTLGTFEVILKCGDCPELEPPVQ